MQMSDDELAVWLILQLSEQGRWEEIQAQMIASVWLSADQDAAEILNDAHTILKRVITLMLDPSEVWPGLLPGNADPSWDPAAWSIIETDDWSDLQAAQAKLDYVKEAFAKNYSGDRFIDYGQRLTAIGEILHGKGVLTPEDDTYTVSIIINPQVRHGELSDLIKDAVKYDAMSALDLAKQIREEIDMFDKMGRWPAEELAAWITNNNQHYIMTWDQAQALVALDEAQEKLEAVECGSPDDFEDIFQGISDQMALQGQEYAAGK